VTKLRFSHLFTCLTECQKVTDEIHTLINKQAVTLQNLLALCHTIMAYAGIPKNLGSLVRCPSVEGPCSTVRTCLLMRYLVKCGLGHSRPNSICILLGASACNVWIYMLLSNTVCY